jgi:hypothetical protein
MKKALIALSTLLLLSILAACASGKGRVEGMLDLLKPVDVAVAVGIGQLVYEVGGRPVWEVETSAAGAQLYRVTLKRNCFANSGDGEAPLLFKRHAERLAASQSCSGYRIVEFRERYDSLLIGTQRVAEGLIECLRA